MAVQKAERNLDVKKATILAIIINALQILLVVAIAVYLYFTPREMNDLPLIRIIIAAAALVVTWGATVDIRDALASRRLLQQLDDMDLTIDAQEQLNTTLRVQRHDFLNHLQVVYSLMEMKEYKEATSYIETVYGDIASVGKVLKTANPAVNALLQVKMGACEKAGVEVVTDIRSAWKELPVPGWEMCKVLGNLIDNALDALTERPEGRKLTVSLTEDLKTYRFAISNNGPSIPEKSRSSIFQPGITTKAAGHGMGLYIVKKTLGEYGGDIDVTSNEQETTFFGWVPRQKTPEKAGKKEKKNG